MQHYAEILPIREDAETVRVERRLDRLDRRRGRLHVRARGRTHVRVARDDEIARGRSRSEDLSARAPLDDRQHQSRPAAASARTASISSRSKMVRRSS